MVKQVIVVRKDLHMRKGKMCAQCAHASMQVWFNKMTSWSNLQGNITGYVIATDDLTPEMIEWKEGNFTKIVVSVDSEDELLNTTDKAITAGLPCALIKDDGLTEFHGIKTNTCVAIGPAQAEEIDKITKGLKLL